MLTVLLRSQADVREKLGALVQRAPRPLIVAQEHELAFGGAFERRLPYRHLLEHGAQVSIVLVADDGHEGLWRDPVGELADRTFADKRQAALATAGYQLFLPSGEAIFLKRDLWDPWNDVRALVHELELPIPVPPRRVKQAERPRFRRAADGRAQDEVPTDPGVRQRRPDTPVDPPRAPEPEPTARDPFAVLGVPPTVDEAGLKKAFRALIVQYHPDKVAHLAEDFRELAERKSRELTMAYDAAQRALRGEPPLE